MPEDLLEWIYDLRLFKLMVPKNSPAGRHRCPKCSASSTSLSAIDGSLGWLVHIGAAGGYFAPRLRKRRLAELFSPREAVIAGSGFPAGRARRTAGVTR